MPVTLMQASKLLNISYRTLWEWVQEAKLPNTKLGNYRLYDYEAVRAVVERHRTLATV